MAAAGFLARKKASKTEIKAYIVDVFGYDLDQGLEYIRRHNRPDVTCAGSVPQAITAFLLSEDYEDAVRKAVSMGGDADTVACMAGGIAEACYGNVPERIAETATRVLDNRLQNVVREFKLRFHMLR